ncbi:unnamed protein product [Gemmataceae bacterium]|nr:unnamed protein product [Gemmataceae bacterium]VTT98874.1 unnamed protein product [Gemmataceae bacterium]
MAKKKVSGQHATPRRTVQLPADWLRVAQELAADRPMPVMWLLIELIRREGEARGRTEFPPVPWAVDGGKTGG